MAADPLDALSTVTWTDISTDVNKCTWTSGRQREGEPCRAGTATVVVDNHSGDYDPMNSSGAHWPDLLPMRRLRISTEYDSGTYYKFTGYVDEFRVDRHNAHHSTVTIKATDAFKLLNLLEMTDPYGHAVLAASPRAFYRFQESGSSGRLPLADSSGNGHAAELFNPLQTVNDMQEGYELVTRDWAPGGHLVSFVDEARSVGETAEASGYAMAPDAGVLGTADFSISLLYRRTDGNINRYGALVGQVEQFAFTDPGDNLSLQEYDYGEDTDTGIGPLALNLRVIRAGVDLLDLHLQLGWTDSLGNFVPTLPGSQGLDQVILTRSGTTFTLYYKSGHPLAQDAAAISTSGVASANPSFISPKLWMGTISGHSYINGVFYGYAGHLGEVAVYPTVLTSDQRTALYSAFNRWWHDAPGERIGKILDQVGFASADRDLEDGVSSLGMFTGGSSALSHIQDAARAEDGIFFFDGEGKAVHYGRRHLMEATRSTTTQVVFGDADDGTEVPYEAGGLDPAMEEGEIYNEVIVQRAGGTPQKATNPTSISTYGRRTLSESGLILDSDTQALARAQFKAEQYSEPVARVRALMFAELDALPVSSTVPPAVGLKLWDRVIYRQRLVNSALWEQDSIVEGMSSTYEAGSGTFNTTVYLSSLPAALADGGFWVLGVSALDLDAKLAY